MSDARREAPLFVQAFDFAAWVATNLDPARPLAESLHRDSLALLDHVVLALKGRDRDLHLEEADDVLVVLRVRLRLAEKVGLIQDQQLVFLTGELDSIGRQVGGWQRRLHGDTS